MTRTVSARRVADLVGDFDREPAYRGLAEGLRVLITDGRVATGTRLPSERDLTAALDVSRTTVTRAYAELREHGYLVSRQGSGSLAALPGPSTRSDHLLHPSSVTPDEIDLTIAAGPPGPGVAAAYDAAVAALPAYLSGSGYHPSGLPVLREAVAQSYADRGLPTSPDQVLVVPGALAGVAVAARALLGTGDRVLLQSPTYPNAIAALRGSRLAGVDTSLDGADQHAADLVAAVRQVAPRVGYLVPDFHNPTGLLLDEDGRARVAAALGVTGTTAVVDESLAALRLDGDAMPVPLAAHATSAWSIGSLSKTHWGGLRVGWLRVPRADVDRAFRARLALDLGCPVVEQLAAAHLIGTPGLLEHRREQLAASQAAAYDTLRRHLPDWRVPRPLGGLSLWCELPEPLSTTLVARAADHGVLLAPGPAFAPEGGLARFVRVPYGLPPHLLTEAGARLGAAWQDTLAAPGRIGRPTDPTLVA
ncbi:GntR family transcriptional regulator [Marmoricola endophyticus]|uniref:GntR family transcriptional regulator n=1 Tax=Marmoricola endophyticus TaxID=2040280 RepID=A0A917F1N6_9ACTN|nr:PLP-dependent aminotransferase family protein [Marmoricola endophyticus]GGF39530.1 GntR family transcriptional regulator [Marmoricola endophyticus]